METPFKIRVAVVCPHEAEDCPDHNCTIVRVGLRMCDLDIRHMTITDLPKASLLLVDFVVVMPNVRPDQLLDTLPEATDSRTVLLVTAAPNQEAQTLLKEAGIAWVLWDHDETQIPGLGQPKEWTEPLREAFLRIAQKAYKEAYLKNMPPETLEVWRRWLTLPNKEETAPDTRD